MTVREKIKTIDKKIEQKTQYNLNGQTAKIKMLSSGNIVKYQFLIGEDILPETEVLEKAAGVKRFESSPLGSKMKRQLTFQEILKSIIQGSWIQ